MFAITELQYPATLFGLLNMYLAARTNIWNWFFGIFMVSIYIVLFFSVKLYADMGLQVIYLVLQFVGLYQWLYGGKNSHALCISRISPLTVGKCMLAFILLFTLISLFLKHFTDSTTFYIDAFTTSLSLIAQWMFIKKWLENWLIWIVVDMVSMYMYIIKNLYATSLLYGIFLGICVYGYYQWKRQLINNGVVQ
jgi:nicotinamide mononucleotide transporter